MNHCSLLEKRGIMELQSQLTHLSSYTSKILRKKFGRGPVSCQANLSGKYVFIYIRGFLSPMEEVMLEQDQTKQVRYARNVVIHQVLEELTGVVQVTLDVEVAEYYHDWNFPDNTGMLLFVLENEINQTAIQVPWDLGALEKEVSRISFIVEKEPDLTKVSPITQNTVIVLREGIFIPIEKALIAKGFIDELRYTKDELEKRHLHQSSVFKEIFKRDVLDIFVDWNMKDDRSFIGFVMK